MHGKMMQCGCVVILAAASFLMTSCGGGGGGSSDGGSSSDSLSAFQAQNLAKSISLAATGSMSSSTFKEVSLSDAILSTQAQPRDPLGRSVAINQSISGTRTCTAGGNMKVLGNISGSISDTGSGLILINATETISDWGCEPPFIINGDPYISLSGQFSFINGVPSTQQHLTINGGIKWGLTAAQSCQIHLDTNFNRDGGGRTTGTVCGETVDISY